MRYGKYPEIMRFCDRDAADRQRDARPLLFIYALPTQHLRRYIIQTKLSYLLNNYDPGTGYRRQMITNTFSSSRSYGGRETRVSALIKATTRSRATERYLFPCRPWSLSYQNSNRCEFFLFSELMSSECLYCLQILDRDCRVGFHIPQTAMWENLLLISFSYSRFKFSVFILCLYL